MNAASSMRSTFSAGPTPLPSASVTVSATGFKTEQFTAITLAVDQTLRLPVTLEPGAVQQSFEVTTATSMLDSVTSSLGQIIDNKGIVDMPLNGRDVRTRRAVL
jgi:hypothetical protein